MPEDQKNEAKPAQQQGDDSKKGGAPAAPSQQRPQQPSDERKFEGWLTEVVDVSILRTGIYGEIKQAMCKILEGKDKGRVIRRNVAGKIQVGDIMRLPDTSREDKPIRAR